MGTSFTWEVSSDRRPVLGMVRSTCLPNVTEIGDWLRPYGSYGPKKTNLVVKNGLLTKCHKNHSFAHISLALWLKNKTNGVHLRA